MIQIRIMVLSSFAPTLFMFRYEMMKSMIERNHEVIAVAPEEEDIWVQKLANEGIKYVSIPSIDRTGTNPIRDLKGYLSIKKVINSEKPDAIFTYQAKTIIYGCLAANRSGIKEIYALIGGLGSVLNNENGEKFKKWILKTEYRIALRTCRKVFFQNTYDASYMISEGLVNDSQVTMINGSGVDLRKFEEKPITNHPVFLFVGRIIKDKGILEYLEASEYVKQRFPDAKMLLVGYFDTNPTSISEELIQNYANRGIIEYIGYREDVKPYLEQCTVFVLPSYHEGTPKSVLEAMAVGRPILTTDIPGCRNTVNHGKNGFLIPPKDYRALAEKMIWMIQNKDKLSSMGKESRKMCVEIFDVDKINSVILQTMNVE